jgi:hypothetical protein
MSTDQNLVDSLANWLETRAKTKWAEESGNASLMLEYAERLKRNSLVELEAENAALRSKLGLRANPEIEAAIQQHLIDGYAVRKLDSVGSCMHKMYESGDCFLGPCVVVEWHDKKVVFSCSGDIDTYPKDEP